MERPSRSHVLVALIAAGSIAAMVWQYTHFKNYSLSRPFPYDAPAEPRRAVDTASSEPSATSSVTAPRSAPLSRRSTPERIIVFIADGFGFDHLSLARQTGGPDRNVWERFAVRGWHDPRPHLGPITDSAASATAIATGATTHNSRVGVDHEGKVLSNVFEDAWQRGFATGIVTDSYIWDATPAAFVAHVEDRDDAATILEQLAASRLDVLFGELEDVGEGPVPEREATEALLARRFELLDEDLRLPEAMTQPVAAIFPEDSVQDESSTPNLTALVATALARLDALERPFLLLVESEEVDSASHRHASQRLLRGLRSIESALLTVLDFAAKRPGTLVLFTSDHETGGLAVGYDVQRYPDLRLLWSTKDHTAALVPLMAIGPGATQFTEVTRAWQVGELLRAMVADIRPAPASSAFSAAAGEPVEDSAEDSRPY